MEKLSEKGRHWSFCGLCNCEREFLGNRWWKRAVAGIKRIANMTWFRSSALHSTLSTQHYCFSHQRYGLNMQHDILFPLTQQSAGTTLPLESMRYYSPLSAGLNCIFGD